MDVHNFAQEKARMVTEKNYTPYMEMKSSVVNTQKEDVRLPHKTTWQQKQNKDEGYGSSLPLGEEYGRKKQRLKEELRLDYGRFMADKRNADVGAQSLQLKERFIKEKLQDERIKDLFKKHDEPRLRNISSTPQGQGRELLGSATPGVLPDFVELRGRKSSPSPERAPSSRKDANMVTEHGLRAGPRPSRRQWEDTRRLERYSSEDELDSEEQEDMELLNRRRPRRHQEPGERSRGGKKLHHRTDRVALDQREVVLPTFNEQDDRTDNSQTHPSVLKAGLRAPTPAKSRAASRKDMSDFATGLMIGVAEGGEVARRRKERYRQELLEQIAEQRENKRKEKELELKVAATGAVDPEKQPDRIKQFGAVRREYEGRRRDAPYRPGPALDLLGAETDGREQGSDEREPPERPRAAFQSPILEYSAALGHLANAAGPTVGAGARTGIGGVARFNEDLHKGVSGALGELVAPRVRGVPPPAAPALSEAYSTPYDDAYYYYGVRNPLDPSLALNGPPVGAVPALPSLPVGAHTSLLQPPAGARTQPLAPRGNAPSRAGLEGFPSDRHLHCTEGALSYKDALKQQIEERQERRRREREERERYDAKLEQERKAYEPWGRGGGGAPLRDDRGNLISDLKQMHRTNEEAYMNPETRSRRTDGVRAASRTEDKDTSKQRVSGFSFTQHSPYARGNVFSDLPTPQQLHEQEKYKESLKQQIEEKRRMETERRARLQLLEEKEERRLAEQRAHIQREYEEEQEKRKKKEMEQNAKNQEIVRQAEERRRETERKRKEEEEKESATVREQYERERQARLEQEKRSQSPPIPTVQKKLGYRHTPRPPSVESQRPVTTRSSCSVSTPRSPPVPAQWNQIRATEDQQGVISELSALRRRLRSEQRRLEGELVQADREESQTPIRSREPPPQDVFDLARLRMQTLARRPPSNTRPVNKQNIQDFNQLKYRDSESREEVRQAYPNPPTDDSSLELQQQALLREQQRRLNKLRRAGDADYFDLSSPMKPPNQRRDASTEEAGRRSLLESESAFIEAGGYSFPATPQPGRRRGPSSARERRRLARRPDFDDGVETPGRQRDSHSAGSETSLQLEKVRQQNQRRMRALEEMNGNGWRSGEISADEGDDLWQQTPSPAPARRVSTTTTATEPWLRPGTTETLKRAMSGHGPSSRSALPRDWDAPSTYHG